jgi:hypothetical protein
VDAACPAHRPLLIADWITPCRHRTATVRAAVARLTIGNCHNAESGNAPSIG